MVLPTLHAERPAWHKAEGEEVMFNGIDFSPTMPQAMFCSLCAVVATIGIVIDAKRRDRK